MIVRQNRKVIRIDVVRWLRTRAGPAKKCSVSSCDNKATDTPYCVDHVLENPYARDVHVRWNRVAHLYRRKKA